MRTRLYRSSIIQNLNKQFTVCSLIEPTILLLNTRYFCYTIYVEQKAKEVETRPKDCELN